MTIFDYRESSDVRAMYEDRERQAAIERRERDRQERLRAEEYHRDLQRRIDENLRQKLAEKARKQAAAEQREAERGERILARVEAARAGVPYSPSRTSYDNPVAEWREAVSEALRACGGNRQRAVCLANRRHPNLREQVIAAANAAR